MASDSSPSTLDLACPASFTQDAFSNILQFQQDSTFTDFTIKSPDNRAGIRCHRLVLAATCPYFSALLNSGMRETEKGEVTIENVSFPVLEVIVQYLYAAPKISVKWNDVQAVIEACEIFQLPALKSQLYEQVLDNISEDNCIGWWKFAEKFSMTDVAKKARDLMCKELEKVSESEEFKMLSLIELLDYINHEDVKEEDRDPVLKACMEWVSFNPEERKDNMMDILRHVDLEKCSLYGLKSTHDTYNAVISDVAQAFMLKTVLQKVEVETPSKKGHVTQKMVILGGMDSNINRICWVKDEQNQWSKFTEFPAGSQASQSPIVCLTDGFAVFCGGAHKTKNTKYDAKSKSWIDLPDAPIGLTNPSAEVCDNKVYLLDGSGGSDVYHLDLASLQWCKDPDMLENMLIPICASLDKKLYAICYQTKKLQCLDTAANRWERKQNVPANAPRIAGARLVATDADLYLVGGSHKVCARYTPRLDTWTVLTPPSLHHHCGSAFVFDGKIYLSGGHGPMTADVSEYDIAKDTWSVLSFKLPKVLTFHKAAMVSFI